MFSRNASYTLNLTSTFLFFYYIQYIIRFLLSGVKALYKGLGPCLLRTFPSSGALLLAVEVTKDVMYNAYDKVV